MPRFDNVDLGHDDMVTRLVARKQAERNALIEECAVLAESCSIGDNPSKIAEVIRSLKELS